jgi:hypothetical protein
MKYYSKLRYPITLLIILFVLLESCKKFVGVGTPQDQLVTKQVFNNSSTATSAVTAIYSKMFNDYMTAYIPLFTGMSADELTSYSTYEPFVQDYTNTLNSGQGVYQDIWNSAYSYIYDANAAIEGIQNSNVLSPAIKMQLIGEAKFIRAFWHFYLVNLFGDVPIIVSTDYRVNSLAPRASAAHVYSQIIQDLKEAENLLNSNFVNASDTVSTTERVRPTKWAATAMLARVYLYIGDWTSAEQESTKIINSNQFRLLSDINAVFLKNSFEAIWQLLPVTPGYNTKEGEYFILAGAPSTGSGAQTTALSSQLISSFDSNDVRRTIWVNWITSGADTFYFPYKYKIASGSSLTEYSMVLRLAEQYLIRSEARAQQDNISTAQSDLNVIRNRAGLPNTTAATKQGLLSAILNERRHELFCEWGHRWFDLKRTQTVDAVMSVITPQKGGTWQSTDQLYPIPQSERKKDPNLTQNPGY